MKPTAFFLVLCIAMMSLAAYEYTKIDPIVGLRSDGIANKQLLGANGSDGFAYFGANDIVSAGSGISVNASGVIANTAPDLPLVLTATGRATRSGTYPNFTINVPNEVDGSVTNELQTVAGSGTSAFTLSNSGGTITLAATTGTWARSGNTLTYTPPAASAQLFDDYFEDESSSAYAVGSTYTVSGGNLSSDYRFNIVTVDGMTMAPKTSSGDTKYDYERTTAAALKWNRNVASGSHIIIRY